MSARLDRTLGALADPARRRTVELLGERPRAAGDLARAIALSPPAMSRHLRVLRREGLVEERADPLDARVRIYSLRSGAMSELKAWLERTEALWAQQLAAFAEHVKRSDG